MLHDPRTSAQQTDDDWLGIPGLRRDLPIDELMDALALDVLRPLTYHDPGIDPVKYEVAVHRIIASLREGSWALVRTSASPLVTECGEYMFAIYDEKGHSAYVTSGVLPHLTGTEAGIKYIRHCYGSDPEGIHPGDQFIVNDPYLLGIHTPDILVARPIFHGDDIVAWIGSLTHTIEIGAKDPGGTADSTDIFQEGIRIPCLKLVSRGEPVRHVFRLIERAVRHPALVSLDITAKVSGNNVAAARIEEMVARDGPAFVRGVLHKMIGETESKARERIRMIPDGRWRNVAHADHNGLEPKLLRLILSATKSDDVIHFDFEGTSPQNPGPINATLPGTIGVVFTVLVSTLLCHLNPNRGIVSSCRISVPKGCMFNPRYPAPIYAAPPGPLTWLSSAATKLVSEMAMAGGLTDAVCAPWNANINSVFMGGADQYGQLQGTLTLDANGGGTGGTPYDDGDDTSAYMLAPGALMADVEMYESVYPLLYLYRRQRRDSAGHGRMRGGLGGESVVAIHNSAGWRVGFRGLGTQAAMTHGLAGGYPADCSHVGYLRGANPQQLSPQEYGRLLGPLDDLIHRPETEPLQSMVAPRPMKPGDIYYLAWAGGGGYGDPLEREPARVLKDVLARVVSSERCRDIYGVVIANDKIDIPATENLRRQIRGQRLTEARPPHDGWEHRLADELGPPIYGAVHNASVSGCAVQACGVCKSVLAENDGDFHDRVPRRDRSPQTIGHEAVRADWQFYREFICPGCGTLLDVTVEELGAAPLKA